MKTKQKRSRPLPQEKPPTVRKTRKKFQFEDGVRVALIAAVVICAAVFGAGGFYIIRSVLNSGVEQPLPIASPAAQEAVPEGTSGEVTPGGIVPEPPASPSEITPETALQDSPSGTASGLEQAIQDLEAANIGAAVTAPAVPPATSPATQPAAPEQNKGVLILVIDDAGNNLRELEPFLQFSGPLTISVLPGLANSAEAARRVRAAGKELFLHQPMEPLNGQDPGPGAVKTGMSPAMVKEIIIKNLNEIGPVSGFNNHEGSRTTSDPEIMRPVLEICRDSALYFLDSRTTANSAAPQIAGSLGITIAQRDIFLDNEQDRESILAALETGCKRAEQNGIAILIGHAWSPNLAALLTEMYPQITKRGLVFSTVGNFLYRGK